jgi:hypothetical protein
MTIKTLSPRRLLRLFFLMAIAILPASRAPAVAGEEPPRSPIKLVVFDFELDDFSAGGPIAGESAVETAMLRRATKLAREQLARSGLFEIVDASASLHETVRAHWLRKCNGCEADVARSFGADMSFIAFFRKISVMEQYLEFRLRDARTGALVKISQADLRGETEESWSRAVIWLIRYGLVEPEQARRKRGSAQ